MQLVAKLTPGRGTWERHLREAPWRGTWVRHVGVRHLGEAPGRGTWERHLGEAPGRGHVWLSVQRHANSLNDRQTTHQTDYLAACHIVHPYRLKSEAQLGPSLKIPKSMPRHTFEPPGLSNLKSHKSTQDFLFWMEGFDKVNRCVLMCKLSVRNTAEPTLPSGVGCFTGLLVGIGAPGSTAPGLLSDGVHPRGR